MRLVDDWKWIVWKGWQFRVTLLAILFSGLEVYFSMINPYTLPEWLPPGTFAAIAAVTSVFANLFRLLAQRRTPNADQQDTTE
ncbi:hypothetical protein EVB39_031 [Rhizobium phage RHph_TM3_3_9]|nr:hypothetical protein EVB39_031 [Rhizobium phage RHph_TM3_3_9]QIG67838.1 hypothetical protein EVB53_036 [Rhizobium phage RHph_Y60]QIG68552.1 hypothetical protein EVB66_031 [Rhizobium phage RHph_TM3_3_13]QIG74410.1 hypothetical protein EVC09_030 [Rhizobium phage RHph_TM3_3_10]QXV74524.1 hypothetical protein [Rhizobium phage RHEph19]